MGQQHFYASQRKSLIHLRWGGRMVQATACRAVIYGFNSHPQLQRISPQPLATNSNSYFRFLKSLSPSILVMYSKPDSMSSLASLTSSAVLQTKSSSWKVAAACHWLRISSDLALRLPRLCVKVESRTPSFWVKGRKSK